MSTNTNLQERAAEIRATAECEMIVKILKEASSEPSTKRFARSRATRLERWVQLAAAARRHADGLLALSAPQVVETVPLTASEAPPAANDAASA